jgi:hypothetical protein
MKDGNMVQSTPLGLLLSGPPEDQLSMPAAPMVSPAAPAAAPQAGGLADRWKGFLGRVQSDPNLRMALMQTGAAMMQSPKFGENFGDVFGRAAQTGMLTLDTLRQRDYAQKEREADRTFDRDVKTKQLGNDTQRTAAAVAAANAQTDVEKAKLPGVQMENSPEYLEKKRRLIDLGLDEKEADIAAAKALANDRNASARLADRTDPNARGSGSSGGSGGGFDVRAAEARAAELRRKNPKMSPEEAKNQAYSEQTEAKKRSLNPTQVAAQVQERAMMISMGLMPGNKEDALTDARNQIAAEMQMSMNPPGTKGPSAVLDARRRASELSKKHAKKQVPISYGDRVVNGRVGSANADGTINIVLDNGAVEKVTSEELLQELGE